MIRFSLIAAAVAVFLSLPAMAQTPVPPVDDIAKYLSSITTMSATFTQEASNGHKASGKILLSRPGRLRVDYAAPMTDFIVADGRMIHYYDGKMKQASAAPISRSLADFFLRKDVTLSGDISVSDIQRIDGLLQVRMVQTEDPLAGELTILFSENPLTLQGWRIVDATGTAVTIMLNDSVFGLPLKDKQFYYYSPDRKNPNLNN